MNGKTAKAIRKTFTDKKVARTIRKEYVKLPRTERGRWKKEELN
jgi:hypothetical protein